MSIAEKLQELEIVLPEPMALGNLPFQLVRVHGDRAIVAGHVPLGPDGRMAKPLGKVGAEVTPEEGFAAARLCGLAMLASRPHRKSAAYGRIARLIPARKPRLVAVG